MSQADIDCRWGVLGHSQRGASHVRQDLPNQDAIAHCLTGDGSPPVILAVADGHGSVKSFRSDTGARLAVETALAVCREFLDNTQGTDFSAVKGAAERGIPAEIFRDWRRRVQEHYQQNEFLPEELDHLAEQAGAAARERAVRPDQLPVAYGATLLVAVLADEFLLCFQLGDGDILAVSDDTGVTERVIPKDESLIANETTSLCQEDGLRHVRCRFHLFHGSPPAMVLLSTDGYSNSFATPEAFLKVGTDYLDVLRTEGAEKVAKSMPGWLEDTSRNGSGDDITVGVIYRRYPLSRPEGKQMGSEVSADGISAEQAAVTKAANGVMEEAAGSTPTATESPAAEAAEPGRKGLLGSFSGLRKRLFGKHGKKPRGTES